VPRRDVQPHESQRRSHDRSPGENKSTDGPKRWTISCSVWHFTTRESVQFTIVTIVTIVAIAATISTTAAPALTHDGHGIPIEERLGSGVLGSVADMSSGYRRRVG
jgi:hypothetical protein